jgi:1,4-dihydroxy-2-naphthoyl-CoA hydrolase
MKPRPRSGGLPGRHGRATVQRVAALHAMPADWEPVVPFDRCFDARYGLEVIAHDGACVAGRVQVGDAVRGRGGVVGSGVYAAAAEALASRGTALAVIPTGRTAMGLSNDTTVTATVSGGALHVEARLVARGADAWVWAVEAQDDAGRVCAFSRVTVAVR